jgi:7-cyano-7-deazaguanine synthase
MSELNTNRGQKSHTSTEDESPQFPAFSPVVAAATEHYPEQIFTRIPEFGSRWTFPSDHLPVAARIDELSIGSFNVLNSKYVHYFEGNEQGLASSSIITEHVPISSDSDWTRRSEDTLSVTHALARQLDLVLLQECSPEFLRRLRVALPDQYDVYTGRSDNPKNQIACILDSSSVSLVRDQSEFSESAYGCRPDYSAMNLLVQVASGRSVQVIHSHVPGNPNMPGLREFAEFISTRRTPDIPVVAVGDMNFPEATVEAVFQAASLPQFQRVVDGDTSIHEVVSVGIEYGQRHRVELDYAQAQCNRFGFERRMLRVAWDQSSIEIPVGRTADEIRAAGVAPTFVPARNAVFLTLASAEACGLGAEEVWIGVNALDYSGYPDCRPEFIRAFEEMMQLAVPGGPKVVAPLVSMTKPEIAAEANRLGLAPGDTWSCYQPKMIRKGLIPCSECDACVLHTLAWKTVV